MGSTEFLTGTEFRPEIGRVLWANADDGVKLRLALWPEGSKGTVLIFSGRTEYLEKYGPSALEFAARGYASATIDWRGQGLSDRLLPAPLVGHVERFSDYQRDVAVLMQAVRDAQLPEPYYLFAHSMGGSIGLRALVQGLNVPAAVFSAPMWDMLMSPMLRPLAWAASSAARIAGFGGAPMPSSGVDNYVLNTDFAINTLTSDRDMWDFMVYTLRDHPAIGLGRPSCNWVYQAMRECQTLAELPKPDVPVWVSLGTEEAVVDPRAIHEGIRHWQGAKLTVVEGARHEIAMETPDLRRGFFDAANAFLDAHP